MVNKPENKTGITQKESAKYLKKFGWTEERRVNLPSYIDSSAAPETVKAIVENLYGLTFVDVDGYKREFTVPDEYIRDFEQDMQEWIEDTGIKLEYYPLGTMSEYGGILVLDQYGRFYLAGDELMYYGDNLEQFVDVVLFNRRCGLSIRENGSTYFSYNDKNTGYPFSADGGWSGDPKSLDIEYIRNQKKD